MSQDVNLQAKNEMLQPEKNMSLVDYLANTLNCEYVGDLHYLEPKKQGYLISVLQEIPTTYFSCWDWNNALVYLTKKLKQGTAEEAQALFLATLKST